MLTRFLKHPASAKWCVLKMRDHPHLDIFLTEVFIDPDPGILLP